MKGLFNGREHLTPAPVRRDIRPPPSLSCRLFGTHLSHTQLDTGGAGEAPVALHTAGKDVGQFVLLYHPPLVVGVGFWFKSQDFLL